MNELQSALWEVWLCYWLSAALVGAFLGNLLAEAAKATTKWLIKKIKARRR